LKQQLIEEITNGIDRSPGDLLKCFDEEREETIKLNTALQHHAS